MKIETHIQQLLEEYLCPRFGENKLLFNLLVTWIPVNTELRIRLLGNQSERSDVTITKLAADSFPRVTGVTQCRVSCADQLSEEVGSAH